MKKFTPKIGIMQGRLTKMSDNKIQSFPHKIWKNEFEEMQNSGFQVLEWIFDDLKNPLFNKEDSKKICLLAKKFNIEINSVCADYFMKEKLFNVTSLELKKNLDVLKKLIVQCAKNNIKIIEIPLVDSSSLKSKNNMLEFFNNILTVLPLAKKNNMLITLETDLSPKILLAFLKKINHPNIASNYDLGNSTSLGYNLEEEIDTYGDFIANIHLKDRKYLNGTVPLGSGDANFDLFFRLISQTKYRGDFIIQGAREFVNNTETPKQTCIKYRNFVNAYVNKYYNGPNIS